MTNNHEEIAAEVSRVLGQEVSPAFIARIEEVSGKPFMELHRDDLIRFIAHNDQVMAAAQVEMASAKAELTRRGVIN